MTAKKQQTVFPPHEPHYTTGQIAPLCSVSPRTVANWIDSGLLKGWRIPGVGDLDRRVARSDLVAFLRAHQMPLCGLTRASLAVLCLGLRGAELAAVAGVERVRVRSAGGPMAAGEALAEDGPPWAVVVDAAWFGAAEAQVVAARVRAAGCGLVVVLRGEDGAGPGGDVTLDRPFDPAALVTALVERMPGDLPESVRPLTYKPRGSRKAVPA